MNGVGQGLISVLTAIVGVAALAVIFAPRANTAGVIGASGQAFSSAISAAVAPVGGNSGPVVALRPATSFGFG